MFPIMDAHLFRRFCDTISPFLQRARIEKIQEAVSGVLVLACHAPGLRKYLCLKHGRRDPFIFATQSRISALPRPSAQIMRLRKYAQDRRIVAVTAQFCQRRLWLLPASGGEERPAWLCLDLAAGPSLVFAGAAEAPEADMPAWPAPRDLQGALVNWRDWPVLTPALRRTLARLPPEEQWALLEDLRQGGGDIFLYGRAGSGICAASAWPLAPAQLEGLEEQALEDAQAALERAGQCLVLEALDKKRADEAAQPALRRRRKLETLLRRLEADAARFRQVLGRLPEALAIQENLWAIDPEQRGGTLWLPAAQGDEARSIELPPGLRAADHMQALFRAAARARRGLEHLARRSQQARDELAGLDSLLPGVTSGEAPRAAALAATLAARAPRNVQVFVSSDGYTLLRGRDARGNLAARRLASPHDIWLHAENGPGAHVIIRRPHAGHQVPERTLLEAGSLAAAKSWLAGAGRGRVQYAELRHVKPMRGAAPGTMRIDRVLASLELEIDPDLEKRLIPGHAARADAGAG